MRRLAARRRPDPRVHLSRAVSLRARGSRARQTRRRRVLGLFGDVWLEMRGPVAGRLCGGSSAFCDSPAVRREASLERFLARPARAIGVARPGDQVVVPGISHGQYYAAADKSYVLYSGKFDVRKGIGLVLEVARRLPDVPFRLVGWGESYAEIAAARRPTHGSSSGGASARNTGHARARASSCSRPVGDVRTVLPEAMAAGCAIVSTSPLPFEGAALPAGRRRWRTAAVRALWDDPRALRASWRLPTRCRAAIHWAAHAEALERVYWRVLAPAGGGLICASRCTTRGST